MTGTTTIIGYRIEIRTSYHAPCMIGGTIVDGTWRELLVDFAEGRFGVPSWQDYFGKKLHEERLMSKHQAQAMRHWFLAQAEAERVAGSLCLETRLVEYRLTIKTDLDVIGRVDAQDCKGKQISEDAAP